MNAITDNARDLLDLDRWRYLARGIVTALSAKGPVCPGCGSTTSTLVKKHRLITALVRCSACKLLYRAPVDPPGVGKRFYQSQYHAGYATDCPAEERLEQLKRIAFAGSSMDFAGRIAVLQALGVRPGARILDFGASWGYGTWQFGHAGYDAVGYEISGPRARYARERVGVRVDDDLQRIGGGFDVFFSSHVIEHLPSPRLALDEAHLRLKSGGLFIAFTPNGSQACLDSDPTEYHKYWGRVHGLYLDDFYYRHAVPDRPKVLCSTPNDTAHDTHAISQWSKTEDLILDLRFSELCVAILF